MINKVAEIIGFKKHEAKIIVIGLDNSGKSCIVNFLKENRAKSSKKKKNNNENEKFESTPTVGFAKEEFEVNNVKFMVYDMSGQNRYRDMWETYYSDVEAIIFVIDSSDKFRVVVAKEELEELMSNNTVRNNDIPILFFANKMDVKGALTEKECADELELNNITDRTWFIVPSNGMTGTGITEGITWLSNTLKLKARGAYK